jgi:DNA-binding transcriptional LysR family regulator
MMDRLAALEAFVAVADRGSFVGAARSLRISPPAMTRTIAGLEAHLGIALFHRSTRAVTLTDEGLSFLDTTRRILADLRDAELAAMGARSSPSGQLHITAPVTFGRLHVLPVVAELLAAHENLSVRLMLIDRNVRIVEEGIDLAVRIGPLADSSLRVVLVGSVRQQIVASPAYLARHGTPETPADLSHHAIIATTGPRAANEWRFGGREGRAVSVKPRLLVNTVDAAIDAVGAGLGIANLLSYQVKALLRDGHAEELLTPYAPPPLPVHILFEARRAGVPAARAFIDAMRDRWKAVQWGTATS